MRVTSLNQPRVRARLARGFILIGALLLVALLAAILYGLAVVVPDLPALDAITDYRPKIPLRVYTADHALIGEFGEEHRDFIPIASIPEMMKKTLIAVEDKRFYEHHGIDYIRALGAAKANLRGGLRQGGSTITMQVARNFYLTRDKHYSRKAVEVALAYKIEAALSKDQILELYMNHIYLGQHAYGFSSAARTYFGKPLDKLSIAEMAMLAGLPQNPARHNPAVNPKRARQRQQLILHLLRDQNVITEAQYQQALHEPLRVNSRGQLFDTHTEYVAEIARQAAYALYKEETYTKGLSVTTTILKADQDAAYDSVRRNVIAYDQRHGYRGPEASINLPTDPDERDDAIDEALQKRPSSDRLLAAVVLEASPKLVRVDAGGDNIDITGEGLRFASAALAPNAKGALKLRPGAIIRITQDGKKNWAITQIPQVAAAFVAVDADSGALRAMVGGFDFNLRQFNHVTQAWRQPGSSIKPFIYSAALDKGYSPATRVLDAALDLPGENAGATWSPQNDDNVYDGPITLRQALAHSKNVVSVRLLRALSVPYAHDHLIKFGFDPARHPSNLTLALGTGAVTPQQMASAYAIFANGGYQVEPYLIARISDAKGGIIKENKAPAARQQDKRVLDERNAFVMDTMLRDVTRYGTGAQASVKLGRSDIAGKTGTTSDAVDGWFAGYGANVVAVAWMGYDDPKSLGGREFGATLALPIWIDYMRVALASRPQQEREVPEGVEQFDGDWMYKQFIEDGALHSIDIDETPQ